MRTRTRGLGPWNRRFARVLAPSPRSSISAPCWPIWLVMYYAPRALERGAAGVHLPDEERRLGELGPLGITLPSGFRPGGSPLDRHRGAGQGDPGGGLADLRGHHRTRPGHRGVRNPSNRSTGGSHPVCRGEKKIAVSISEPDAGSAATDMSTRARMDGDEIVIDGMKRWCSGAGYSEQYLVYLRLGEQLGARGISAAIPDAGTPGLEFGPQERLMGFRGIGSGIIYVSAQARPGCGRPWASPSRSLKLDTGLRVSFPEFRPGPGSLNPTYSTLREFGCPFRPAPTQPLCLVCAVTGCTGGDCKLHPCSFPSAA